MILPAAVVPKALKITCFFSFVSWSSAVLSVDLEFIWRETKTIWMVYYIAFPMVGIKIADIRLTPASICIILSLLKTFIRSKIQSMSFAPNFFNIIIAAVRIASVLPLLNRFDARIRCSCQYFYNPFPYRSRFYSKNSNLSFIHEIKIKVWF